MKKSKLPSKKEIQEVLNYDQNTGIFTWKERPSSGFKEEYSCRRWNKRYAGTEAGYFFNGYCIISINKKKYMAHRLAWVLCHGEEPDHIDHINHNRSDNRIKNLRSVSHRENLMNMTLKKSNRSGVTGVYLEKQTGKWRSYINVLGKSIKLGRFDDFNEAVKSRLEAEKRYGFHENHGIKI